jgi:hypothetical protein
MRREWARLGQKRFFHQVGFDITILLFSLFTPAKNWRKIKGSTNSIYSRRRLQQRDKNKREVLPLKTGRTLFTKKSCPQIQREAQSHYRLLSRNVAVSP